VPQESSHNESDPLAAARQEIAYYRKLVEDIGRHRLREAEELSAVITQLRRAEQELEQARNALEQRVEQRTSELRQANESLSQEILERKRMEAELRQSERRFSLFMQFFPGLAFIKDADLRILMANEGFKTLLGLDPAQLIGRLDGDVFPPDLAAKITAHDRRVLASGCSARVEEEFAGRHWVSFKFPIPRPDALPMLGGLTYDITDRKRAEQEKEKLQAQLLQAQKMESVGRLAGGVAHDFNNMLLAILGNVALALEQAAPSTQLHEDLCEIQKAAERSADLTRQLLTFARKQTIAPKILDLNDAIAGMLKMLQRLIGENIRLAWLPGRAVWPVKIDPTQVDQILANLAVNARDAIVGPGTVTIETNNLTLDEAWCKDQADVAPGDYVQLVVSDTGAGLSPDSRAHLFEPFFTTKAVGEGTGLGLATIYGIVKQNNGLISVASEPGLGTTFKICLPRSEAAVGAISAAEAKPPPKGDGTILLVEDEEQVLSLSRRILAHQGYRVLAARTAEEALELLEQHPGVIRLLITDVVMPGLNGWDLKQGATALQPGLRCLFMSGYSADVVSRQGVLVEGVHFLQKPFTIDALITKVGEILKSEGPQP